MSNPLLAASEYIDFGQLVPVHVTEAVDQHMARIKQSFQAALADTTPTFDSLYQLLYDTEALSDIWNVANQLHGVINSDAWREVIGQNLPKITQLFTTIRQDPVLYQRLKWLLNHGPSLSTTQRTLLTHQVRDFVLSGAELLDVQKNQFLSTQQALAALALKFEQNVLDATDAAFWYIETADTLQGIPQDMLAAFEEAAQKDGKTGYKLTLQGNCYEAVQNYADNRALREKLFRAYVTRASELGKMEYDNTDLISQHLSLHQKIATLLGYASYAEVSLVPKMAKTPQQVIQFLRDLAKKGRNHAKQEWAQLSAFAASNLGLSSLEPWDVLYAAEQFRQTHHALSDALLRSYFPLPKVLSGLFRLIHQLYGITIEPKEVPVWHPQVTFYQLRSAQGHAIGGFYLHLYARAHKRGGAWMNNFRSHYRYQGSLQQPIAAITCNFTLPATGQVALLTPYEIRVLFHEMGHCLHHLLTQVDEIGLSSIDTVEWDAVELPSQFMERFCWEWDVLQTLSEHVETKASLPLSLYQSMHKERTFRSASQLLRQVEFSLLDMMLHSRHNAAEDWKAIAHEVHQEVAVMSRPEYERLIHSFLHIFAGGYMAGYYSYLWAEVLASDVYAAFQENPDRSAVGQRFWETLLAVGGSRPTAESFRAFRGRDPDIIFLLKDKGLKAKRCRTR